MSPFDPVTCHPFNPHTVMNIFNHNFVKVNNLWSEKKNSQLTFIAKNQSSCIILKDFSKNIAHSGGSKLIANLLA
jgi:hypothetical protein